MSTLWSAHPEQSLRRGTLLVCVYVAALGLARQFSPREFLAMVFVISSSWFVFSIGLELALGRFQPTSENYRFSAIMHPNSQGVHAAILCLASVAILFDAARRHSFAGCTLLAASCALLLTRSRTALLALIAAIIVLWLARTGTRKLSWILVLAVTVSGVALVAGFAGQDVENSVFDALLLGRNEDVSSLTGRVPLWTALSDFALQRPLGGYGYGAFWDPERTEQVADAAYVRGWNIPDAHSSYIDALLALGMIGAAALVVILALAIVRAVGRYRSEPNAANTFLLGLLTFGAVNALTESSLMEPSFFYYLTICAVIQLTFSTAIEQPPKPLLPSRMRRMAIAVPPPN
jgi:O-antigen ligase